MALLDALRCMFELQMMCHLTESGGEDGGGGHWLVRMEWRPAGSSGVSASVNLPLHHEVQKFSSATGWPGWSRKKAVNGCGVWWNILVIGSCCSYEDIGLVTSWLADRKAATLECLADMRTWLLAERVSWVKWFEARDTCWLVVTVCRQLQKLGHLLRVGGSSATEMHGQVMQLVARAAIKVVHCCCWCYSVI